MEPAARLAPGDPSPLLLRDHRPAQGDASGVSPSIFGPLVVLPVTWFAIYGTGRELGVSIFVMALTLFGPIAVIGGREYTTDEVQRTVLAVGLAATLGPAVHLLVVALRRMTNDLGEAEERFRRGFDDSQVGMALVSTSGRFQRVQPGALRPDRLSAAGTTGQDLW